MAVVRSRSAPPYGLILFVALWVVSTVLAVLFYLKWGTAQQDAEAVTKRYAPVVRPNELTSIVPQLTAGSTDRSQRTG